MSLSICSSGVAVASTSRRPMSCRSCESALRDGGIPQLHESAPGTGSSAFAAETQLWRSFLDAKRSLRRNSPKSACVPFKADPPPVDRSSSELAGYQKWEKRADRGHTEVNVLSACSTASSGSSTSARGCISPFPIFRSAVKATSSIGGRDSAANSADSRGFKGSGKRPGARLSQFHR